MAENHSIEILDLRHYSARQLRPLLEQEARVWEARLGWDYRSSIELILQYLDSRILPGFVATIRGRVCGLAFCVYEGHKAVIGDVFVSREIELQQEVIETLLRHLLDVLGTSPDIDRIESQLLLFDSGTLRVPFESLGFSLFPRLYQERQLNTRSAESRMVSPLPVQLEILRWSSVHYQATAELIHGCYAGHVDAGINDQYRTLHGSLRFLHNIIRFPGCGTFEQSCSWVLRDPKKNGLVAVALCSRIAATTAHVTQLCVAPEWRGRHLGRWLMLRCMENLSAQSYRTMTLTVTEANDLAVRLYADLGFVTRHRFDAMVRDKGGVAYRIPLVRGKTSDVTGEPPTFFSARTRST